MIILCVILALVCVFLGVKLFCLQRGIDEVCEEFQEKMEEDTNTLITVSAEIAVSDGWQPRSTASSDCSEKSAGLFKTEIWS